MSRIHEKDSAMFVAYDDHEFSSVCSSEKGLMRAILTTALMDLKKDGVLGRKALEYFHSDEEDYIFSFKSICGYLDIDAIVIQKYASAIHAAQKNAKKRTRVP